MKPIIKNLINSGIYIFKSSLINFVPKNTYLDITSFITKLKKKWVFTNLMITGLI